MEDFDTFDGSVKASSYTVQLKDGVLLDSVTSWITFILESQSSLNHN